MGLVLDDSLAQAHCVLDT